MDIQQIQSLLPHRYPFLLVDRVIEVEPGKRLVAIKNVTINEPFSGHFPSKPVMPGVLLIEAMAQATGLLAMEARTSRKRRSIIWSGRQGALQASGGAGDQLVFEVEVLKHRRDIWVLQPRPKWMAARSPLPKSCVLHGISERDRPTCGHRSGCGNRRGRIHRTVHDRRCRVR